MPIATAIITVTASAASPALTFPQQSVFDKAGNQWVTDHNSNTVLVFTAAQLQKAGTNALTPAVTITSDAFNGPLGIVFDANGNLFVANNGGVPVPAVKGAAATMTAAGTTIVEFLAANVPAVPAAAAAAPTKLTPDVVLSDSGGATIQAPWALVFDHAGNLFSSNANPPNTLVAFAPASLKATGSPTPTLTISPATIGGNMTLVSPNGICFDAAFDLAAVSSVAPFGLAVYDAPLMGGSATPGTFIAPGVTLNKAGMVMVMGSTLNAPAGCNFGPSI